jgi:hypothetical protein
MIFVLEYVHIARRSNFFLVEIIRNKMVVPEVVARMSG